MSIDWSPDGPTVAQVLEDPVEGIFWMDDQIVGGSFDTAAYAAAFCASKGGADCSVVSLRVGLPGVAWASPADVVHITWFSGETMHDLAARRANGVPSALSLARRIEADTAAGNG
jgi:hypothetical protein